MRMPQGMERKLTSDRFDAGFGQVACWLAAVLMLVLGFVKLTSLSLTETELFLGVMLVLTLALLCVNLGMLLRIDSKQRERDGN